MPIIWIGLIIVGVIGITCLILSHFELHRLVVTEYEIASPKLEQIWEGYRIAVLGDLHNNEFGENNETLIRAVKDANPDIILIVGDLMVVKEWKEKDFSVTDTILKGLSKLAPVYYANGNHELRMEQSPEQYPGWNQEFQQILKKYQIHYLVDQTVLLKKGGTTIALSGLNIGEEYYQFKGKKRQMPPCYIENKIGNPKKDQFHILMAHTPLYVEEYAQWGADLVFSGHFHGGTIRLPILGGVMTPQMQFFSGLDRGLVKRGETRMIVTGGLGTHSINIRLNNPPELVMVTLRSGDRNDRYQKGKRVRKKL
ncbi:phosphodiesterase YaeI [Clostridiales bacterium CHKCI001]|nr:phosphodiesterase YaeI [Clostridiales bacterium CHKCI001]